VVFDKTGVLTLGDVFLRDTGGLDEARLKRAIGLAAHSTHPLAQALFRYGEEHGLEPAPVTDISEVPGSGLHGFADGRDIRLGSAPHCGLAEAESGSEVACWYSEDGFSPAEFRFSDSLRPDAAEAVQIFRDASLPVSVLSGDRSEAVADAARDVGIAESLAGMRPEDKIARIEAWQGEGATVMMVGDGINDAPALSAASVSMAPSTGSDIGRTAADLVFTGESLSAVTDAWSVARRTRRVILQNFAIAGGYNAIAIPVAALGYAGPLTAAIAMSSSSLLVTVNALRLNGGTK